MKTSIATTYKLFALAADVKLLLAATWSPRPAKVLDKLSKLPRGSSAKVSVPVIDLTDFLAPPAQKMGKKALREELTRRAFLACGQIAYLRGVLRLGARDGAQVWVEEVFVNER